MFISNQASCCVHSHFISYTGCAVIAMVETLTTWLGQILSYDRRMVKKRILHYVTLKPGCYLSCGELIYKTLPGKMEVSSILGHIVVDFIYHNEISGLITFSSHGM